MIMFNETAIFNVAVNIGLGKILACEAVHEFPLGSFGL
jgi:hypothetical protein